MPTAGAERSARKLGNLRVRSARGVGWALRKCMNWMSAGMEVRMRRERAV